MREETKTTTQDTNTAVKPEATTPASTTAVPATTGAASTRPPFNKGDRGSGQKGDFKKNKRTSKRAPKQRSEFDQKIIDIRRVTRVSSGGRRFSFSVAIVVGNRKGRIGVGMGKAGDTSLAIDKAAKDAQKNAITVKTTKTMSIPHQVEAKYNSARIMIMPAPKRGVIAGSSMRDIVELGGLNDLNGKILSGSKNKLNIAKATIKAFQSLEKTNFKEDTKVAKK